MILSWYCSPVSVVDAPGLTHTQDFELNFEDNCMYGLDDIPALRFLTSDPHFCFCVSELGQLLADDVPARLEAGQAGEGTYEMELYIWLYSCFTVGCSSDIARAWYDSSAFFFASGHCDLRS
jgi:hypothetical protein